MIPDYQLVDFDNHYYETDECFTRNIEPEFRDQAIRFVKNEDSEASGLMGNAQTFFGDQPSRYAPPIAGDRFAAPAAMRKGADTLAEGVKANFMSGTAVEMVRMVDIPAFIDRDARLDVMDERHTEAAVLHGTTALALMRDLTMIADPDVLYADLRSFNRWVDEEWGFNYKDRLFSAPLIALNDVDRAVAELDRVLDEGARVFELLHFGPGSGHSLGGAVCDPFWARVNESGIVVSIHGDGVHTNLTDLYSPPGHVTPMMANEVFQLMLASQGMLHMLGSMIFQGAFARFPDIKIVSIETNGAWVHPTMTCLDAVMNSQRLVLAGGWGGDGTPSEIMRRHVILSLLPFKHEAMQLAEMVGPENLCLGSDYPHPEGLVSATDFFDEIADLNPQQVKAIMRDTGAELLRI